MITKKFGIDFNSGGGALTLPASAVGGDENAVASSTCTHDDGWTITGEVHEDYYTWVNKFDASHPMYGRVWGDFEDEVFADSEEGFADFYAKHPPEAWDYGDI